MLGFLRRKVGVKEAEGLFCYVNSVFAPGLDEGVGNLYRVCLLSLPLVRGFSGGFGSLVEKREGRVLCRKDSFWETTYKEDKC